MRGLPPTPGGSTGSGEYSTEPEAEDLGVDAGRRKAIVHERVVRDATAGPRHPVWGDGYQVASTNCGFFAHALLSTDEILEGMD